MFIVERPYTDFEILKLDSENTILVPRAKTAYEFYTTENIKEIGDTYFRFVVKEKVTQHKNAFYNRLSFYLENISLDKVIAEEPRASYIANSAVLKIEKNMPSQINPLCGYNVYISDEFVGVFSEFGQEEDFSTNCNGFLTFDFNTCTVLQKVQKTLIHTRDYDNEKSRQRFVDIIKRMFPNYIRNFFPISGYRIVGLTDDSRFWLIKSNQPVFEAGKQEYAFYEFNEEKMQFSRVVARATPFKNGYITSFIDAHSFAGIHDFNVRNSLCGMSFELIKGFSITETNQIENFFEVLSVGGEIRKYNIINRNKYYA